MAIVIHEMYDSRELNADNKAKSGKFHYICLRSTDELEVYNTVENETPAVWQGLVRRRINVKPLGGNVWDCTVDYETPEGSTITAGGLGGIGQTGVDRPAPDSSGTPAETDSLGEEFNFDISAGTTKITQSLETMAARPGGGFLTALPFNRAINVGTDSVEGCEIITPKMEFSYSRRLDYITLAYVKDLHYLTGKVNSEPFLHFPAGELLFMGASGNFREQDGWTVNYKFAAAKNEAVVTIVPDGGYIGEANGLIILPEHRDDDSDYAKLGWEYVWVKYNEEEVMGRSFQVPRYAYVEKVYETVEFQEYLGWGD